MIAPRILRAALVGVAACSLYAAPAARADFITFGTPTGSKAGSQPVDAQAAITTGNGTITITLTNLQADPTSDIQSVASVSFGLSNNPTGSLSIASQSSVFRTISAGTKTFTDVATTPATPTNWTVGFTAPAVTLAANLPTQTLIGGPSGDGKYDSANPSITNSNHNPFLGQTASFTLTAPGITAGTHITGLTFAFGTDASASVTGIQVPEPSSIALLVLGGGGAIGLVARRRLARARSEVA